MRFQREQLSKRLSWDDIDPGWLSAFAEAALREDLEGVGLKVPPIYKGDITTALLKNAPFVEAKLVARESMVVAGLGTVHFFLKAYESDATFTPCVFDGMQVEALTVLGFIRGDAAQILQAERPILNTLQHLSGVATHAALYQKQLANSNIRLLDTRKTLPGWRLLEKYAVCCGGAYNHRLGLFDRILIKDNHLELDLLPQLNNLVGRARVDYPGVPVEIEIDRLDQIERVLAVDPDVILLDNFPDDELRMALKLIGSQVYTEASGGITLNRLPSLACLPLDFISTSQLNRGATAVDIGLDF